MRARPLLPLLPLLAPLLVSWACTDGSTSPLAARDDGTTGRGGAADAGAEDAAQEPIFDGAPTKDAAKDAPFEAETFDATPDVFKDPDGKPELRFVHGMVDTPMVRLCLVPWVSGAPSMAPAAEQSMDVPYGRDRIVTVPVGGDLAGAYRPAVLSGDFSAIAGVPCASVVAAPPSGLRVAWLPVLPAGTLSAPRSLLLVATGCMGGVTIPDIVGACGVGVGFQGQRADATLVEMSRVPPPQGKLGVQAVHGSLTLAPVTISLVSSEGAKTTVASMLTLGTVAPKPPLAITPDTLGANPLGASAKAVDTQGELTGGTDEIAAAGLSAVDLSAGRGVVLVALAARAAKGVVGQNPMRLVWLRAPTPIATP